MKKSQLVIVLLIIVAAVLTFLYSGLISRPLVSTRTDETFGNYLVGKGGMTLYVYVGDRLGAAPSCYDECLEHWTPFLSDGANLEESEDPLVGNLRLTTRRDGSVQYTYLGKPLYYFETDEKPGDMTGRGLNGLWSIVLIREEE